MTKTATAFQTLESGDVRGALKILSTFKLGLTPAQRKAIKLGYEVLTFPKFYMQLKVDVPQAVENALRICAQLRPKV